MLQYSFQTMQYLNPWSIHQNILASVCLNHIWNTVVLLQNIWQNSKIFHQSQILLLISTIDDALKLECCQDNSKSIYVQCNTKCSSIETFTCFFNTKCTSIGHPYSISLSISCFKHVPSLGDLSLCSHICRIQSIQFRKTISWIISTLFTDNFCFSKFCNVFMVFNFFVSKYVIITNKCKL